MPNAETVGEVAHVWTSDHPKRTDSPAYKAARRDLMGVKAGGCIVCGGPVDLAHPELASPGDPHGLEDHHGGGVYLGDVLVALNLFPLEWSQGWAADPAVVERHVANLNVLMGRLGEPTYDDPIADTASVMAWVDSTRNANVKYCKAHHVGTQHQHTPDANGHEAVGIHEIPGPIFWGQVTCEWARFDMWAGTTGTVAVVPHGSGRQVQVIHAHHATGLARGQVLPVHHPHARLAHAGAHVDRQAA